MSIDIISWNEYTDPHSSLPISNYHLAVTVGVFDGIHLGHQVLIRKINEPLLESVAATTPTVVTFKQNPMSVLKPGSFTGDIIGLDQKIHIMETLGVQLVVLIDFSENFSKISGRDFIDLLINRQPVELIALGKNFRCGHNLDTGAAEIQAYAEKQGVKTWVADPVMDDGKPVSSSRIRQALAEGKINEAKRLLGWPLEYIPLKKCSQ